MATYICCNPQCGNVLFPTGPIQAFVSTRNTSFKLPIFFNIRGAMEQNSLDEVANNIGRSDGTKNIQMTTDDAIGGTLGDFNIQQLDLKIESFGQQTQITQTITLHCSFCGSYCQYTA